MAQYQFCFSWVNHNFKSGLIHNFGYCHHAVANRDRSWETFFKTQNLFKSSRMLRAFDIQYVRVGCQQALHSWGMASQIKGNGYSIQFPWTHQNGVFSEWSLAANALAGDENVRMQGLNVQRISMHHHNLCFKKGLGPGGENGTENCRSNAPGPRCWPPTEASQ